MKDLRPVVLVLASFVLASTVSVEAQRASPERYDVEWASPSADASGSMPLGNGDVALNAWVDPSGALWFYVAKGDAWSENGRLLKVGRVRVALEPAVAMTPFRQTLELDEATLVASCGEGRDAATWRLWVDANANVVHVTFASEIPRRATLSIEPWRIEREEYPAAEVSDLLEDRSKPNRLHERVFVEPDTVIAHVDDGIGWFHHNAHSVGVDLVERLQGLTGWFEGKPDPLHARTFGAWITARDAERIDDHRLRARAGTSGAFRVHVATAHPSTPTSWFGDIRREAERLAERSDEELRVEHVAWWRAFWERSWIHVSSRGVKTSMVPSNAHDVRIGEDQGGGNAFVGEIGRLTVWSRASDTARIRALARVPHDADAPSFDEERVRLRPIGRTRVEASSAWTFREGVTIEAWLRLGDLGPGGGRILDKITPGGSDGLLLDTHPGRGLRLIVGRNVLAANDVLPRDAWVHVAAVVDPNAGRITTYVHGEPVAEAELENVDDAFVVSRAYALQRFIDACAGRGRYPIKFNGSLFTVPAEGTFGDADYRRWGPGYWWQNTRLPYLHMCASGDFDLMRALFRMYAEDLLPLHRHRTRLYTGHEGAFVPECMLFFGPIFTATYGWTPFAERGEDKLQESGWHKWEWVSGLELVWMMLDHYEHTLDAAFARDVLLPTAHEILTFFDRHYGVDQRGTLVMHPSQALETWWDCTNPMPEVAGLHAVTARLLALPEDLGSAEERAFWKTLTAKLPRLPTFEKDGVRRLAPAEVFADKRNVENPELYAVFPFRLVSFEKANAPLGIAALEQRWDRGHFGWRQDELFMAVLGLAEPARSALVQRARTVHAGSRFPAYWGPNYDWVPDQDHGGILTRTLQCLLMQTEGRKIFLLPAWPADWDADFQLHAPFRTTVSGRVRGGRLVDLEVTPQSRRADVIVRE